MQSLLNFYLRFNKSYDSYPVFDIPRNSLLLTKIYHKDSNELSCIYLSKTGMYEIYRDPNRERDYKYKIIY